MKLTENIKSNTLPTQISYNESAVYVRSNIRQVTENDPVFNTPITSYIYDEMEYSIMEFMMNLNDRVTLLETQIEK